MRRYIGKILLFTAIAGFFILLISYKPITAEQQSEEEFMKEEAKPTPHTLVEMHFPGNFVTLTKQTDGKGREFSAGGINFNLEEQDCYMEVIGTLACIRTADRSVAECHVTASRPVTCKGEQKSTLHFQPPRQLIQQAEVILP